MQNKHIAVTGGATGISAEVVAKLLQAGAKVTVFDIVSPTSAVDYVAINLADQASIDHALDATGQFDGLCNIAGLPPQNDNAVLVLGVNFIGMRQFTLGMYDKLLPGSSIVNVSSLAGGRWRQNLEQILRLCSLTADADLETFITSESLDPAAAYNLSKEAVTAWSIGQCESLIGRDIRMNTVSPGGVQTRILDDFVKAFGDKVAQNLKRVGRASRPEEVADAILFLLSEKSHWIKGIDIVVDGGIAACNQSDMLGLSTNANG